jgi:hypothetical protein
MKKLFSNRSLVSGLSSLLLLTFFAVGTLSVSCNRSTEETPPGGVAEKDIILGSHTPNQSITLREPLTLPKGITLPAGTLLRKSEDDPYSLAYQLPQGYKLVGRATGSSGKPVVPPGTPLSTAYGSVTCSCTSGTGCSPYVASLGGQTTIGCNLGASCSQCTKKVTALVAPPAAGGAPSIPSATGKQEIGEASIINFNLGISFVTNPEMKAATTSPTDAFLDLPDVQAALQQFMTGHQRSNLQQVYQAKTYAELPDNYVVAGISLFGKLIFVPIDRDLNDLLGSKLLNEYVLEKSEAKNGRLAGYSCACGSGTSGCTLGSKSIVLVGSVTYCNATVCSVCTLKW